MRSGTSVFCGACPSGRHYSAPAILHTLLRNTIMRCPTQTGLEYRWAGQSFIIQHISAWVVFLMKMEIWDGPSLFILLPAALWQGFHSDGEPCGLVSHKNCWAIWLSYQAADSQCEGSTVVFVWKHVLLSIVADLKVNVAQINSDFNLVGNHKHAVFPRLLMNCILIHWCAPGKPFVHSFPVRLATIRDYFPKF